MLQSKQAMERKAAVSGFDVGDDAGTELELLRAVVETAVDGFLTMDVDGTILSANPAALSMFGYQAKDLIGQNVKMLMPATHHEGHVKYLRNYASSGMPKMIGIGREVQGRRKDGTLFAIDLAVGEHHTGIGTVFTGTVRDITARKQAEEDVRRERALFKAVVETAVDGIVTIDEKGTVLTANPAVALMFGYAPKEIVGQSVRMLMPSVDHEEFDRHLNGTAVGKVNGVRRELQGRRKDGTVLPLDLAVSETMTEHGRIFTGILRDMTAKLASVELQLAKEAADRANVAKSEFLSRMSHELRTPLNSVLGFSQILQMRYADPKIQEATGSILRAGQHLLNLINEVLDLSRIESGKAAVSLEPVPVRPLLAQAVDLVRPLAEKGGVTISMEGQLCADTLVKADRQKLLQVFINLLSNAVKFNRRGGRVDVSCEATPENGFTVIFSDTGVGIPADLQSRLFQPFERFGDLSIEGTGLGLVLSLRFAELMGGSLVLANSGPEGSTFHVNLRQVDEEPLVHRVTDDFEAGAVHRSGYKGKVLCIEDNLSNMAVIEMVFEEWPGIEIIPALQGTLGLELASSLKPDVVLLDLHLPDMHGSDVLQRLRADPETSAIPIVIISADATPGQIRRLKEAGAVEYLTKPLDIGQFTRVLTSLLPTEGGEGDDGEKGRRGNREIGRRDDG